MGFRCGTVALIGKPNVGKSTLVNLLVGQKVSIVSDKRQTTRNRVLGIATSDDYQIVLMDTPGIHHPHTRLGKTMNDAAKSTIAEVDLIVFVAEANRPPQKEDQEIAALLKSSWKFPLQKDHPGFNGVILCLNKMDLLKAEHVVENVEAYCGLLGTEQYMLTCLTKGQNVDKLTEMILRYLPEGEPLFPADEFTDQPLRRLAAELVREKALAKTRQEIPHAIATLVDVWEDEPDTELTRIVMSIVVEKDGQKAILIGKGGQMLKQIGAEARAEIEALLERRVYLQLIVKVREEWRQNPRMLHELGLDSPMS